MPGSHSQVEALKRLSPRSFFHLQSSKVTKCGTVHEGSRSGVLLSTSRRPLPSREAFAARQSSGAGIPCKLRRIMFNPARMSPSGAWLQGRLEAKSCQDLIVRWRMRASWPFARSNSSPSHCKTDSGTTIRLSRSVNSRCRTSSRVYGSGHPRCANLL